MIGISAIRRATAAAAVLLFSAQLALATGTTMPAIETQVLLDRAGFSPGEIDARPGRNVREALAAFRAARNIAPGARGQSALLAALGEGSIEPIVAHTITTEEAAGPFAKAIPADMTAQSRLPGLYYRCALEELGERFHSAPRLLQRLNPGARFTAGEVIRVPNVLAERVPGVRPEAGEFQIIVSKKRSVLTVQDRQGRIVFHAPVTSGSEHDPLPLGRWLVTGVVRNPKYSYDPELFWNADPSHAKATIAPGPNNPVGVVWIDINKPHYGIHGTPEPSRIGHSESHGCVRLTNWDASELAALVTQGTPILFED